MNAARKLAEDIANASTGLVTISQTTKGHKLKCPCHNDAKSSLIIYERGPSGAYAKCFGGCAQSTLRKWCKEHEIEWPSSGTSSKDEWEAQLHFPPEIQAFPNSVPPFRIDGVEFAKPQAWWALRTEPNGVIIEFVCRFTMPDGSKEMRPLSYQLHKGTGAFGYKYLGSSTEIKPLYGAEFLAANPSYGIVVVEGEKTRDAAQRLIDEHELEYIAVTSPFGAKREHKADWAVLKRRREVILWGDNDLTGPKAGENYIINVGLILQKLEIPLRRVELPEGMPNKWDIADWYAPKPGDVLPEGFDPLEILLAAPAWTPSAALLGVVLEDFYALMTDHLYIFVPTRATWPAVSVNARLGKIKVSADDSIAAAL